MRAFCDCNPIVVTLYFCMAAGIAMVCMNPILLSLSLLGALLFFLMQNRGKPRSSHLFYLLLFWVMTLINPLFSHNGETVLFVLNDSPITAEALLYGAVSALMIVAVLYWFRSFTEIMTSDRLLYLFGKLSPRLALVLSMALRYIPLFKAQSKKVSGTQRALGLYKDGNLIDRARGGLRVFSVTVTWALENGIVTADSMSARGYGIGRRTSYSVYRFNRADVILLFAVLLLSALTVIPIALGDMTFTFYPTFEAPRPTLIATLGYFAYGILALLPTFIEAEETIKWKYLESKI